MEQALTPTRETSKWLVLGIAATATLLGTSDFSIVIIAFPTFAEVFDTSTSTVVWVSLAFQLMTLGLVLPMGRLGDLYGRHPIFIIGLGVYVVGLLLAAVSPNIWFLIGVRALLGVAAAMTGAISVAIIASTFPSTERGKALGVIASVAGIGLMVGPSLGGVLLDTLGWRSIFYVRAPVALVSLLMAMRYLPAIAASRGTGRMDIPGAVLLFVSLVTLAFGINQGGVLGWASPQVIGLLAFGIVGSATFIMFELRSKSPIIDLRVFKGWSFSVANAIFFMFTASSMALAFLMPFYLVVGRSLSLTSAGLVLLTNPTVQTVLAPLAGRLSDSVGPRVLTPVGLACAATGFALISTLSSDSPVGEVVAYLALFGIGTSLFNTPNQSAILGAAPPERLGTVSALISTLRNTGLIVGLAAAEAIFSAVAPDAGGRPASGAADPSQAGPVVEGMRTTLRVFAGALTIAALLALTRGRPRPHVRVRTVAAATSEDEPADGDG